MSVKKYDVIFSLGSACLCSQTLRKLHLQFCSYPMDWVTGGNFLGRVEYLVSDFKDYFNQEDLVFYPKWKEPKKNVYQNTRSQIIFPHDFPLDAPFEISFPDVKEKYNRRIARLINNIEHGKKILIVYVCPPVNESNDVSDQGLEDAYTKIVNRFPNKDIDLLYIICSENVDEQKIGEHIYKCSFDYTEDGIPPYKLLHLRAFMQKRKYKLKQSLYDRLKTLIFKIRKKKRH